MLNPQSLDEILRSIPRLYLAYGWTGLGDFTYCLGITEFSARQQFGEQHPKLACEGVMEYISDPANPRWFGP